MEQELFDRSVVTWWHKTKDLCYHCVVIEMEPKWGGFLGSHGPIPRGRCRQLTMANDKPVKYHSNDFCHEPSIACDQLIAWLYLRTL